MSFRKLPKTVLQTSIPVEIAREVGRRAVDQGKLENQFVSELLCIGLGMDPSAFGIKPRPPETSPSVN